MHRALVQPTEAAKTTREWATLVQGNSSELYNVASSFALCVPLARGDQKRELEIEAVQTLRDAMAAGWNDAQRTSHDPSLASLHYRADFRRLLTELYDRGFPANPFA